MEITEDRIALLEDRIRWLEERVRRLENPPITMEERRRRGEMEGLQPGPPLWYSPEDRQGDYEGLRGDQCGRCGHVGQSPRYWHSDDPRTLLSLAVCDECRHSEPF